MLSNYIISRLNKGYYFISSNLNDNHLKSYIKSSFHSINFRKYWDKKAKCFPNPMTCRLHCNSKEKTNTNLTPVEFFYCFYDTSDLSDSQKQILKDLIAEKLEQLNTQYIEQFKEQKRMYRQKYSNKNSQDLSLVK